MLIGILNDLNKNTIYNIYLNNRQGKLIFNVKCIDDEKYYYLNQTEVQNLFSKLFKYEKTFYLYYISNKSKNQGMNKLK